ncbi:MAG: hypothetical protein AAF282_14895 [Cyanobacteria bacterium P01_A01_bin.15]
MFQDSSQGATASTVYPTCTPETLPQHDFEDVRHLLLGSLTAVQRTILELHTRQYAEPNDWSRPLATGRPNEVMAILTRRVRVD